MRTCGTLLIWAGRLTLSIFGALVLLLLISDGMLDLTNVQWSDAVAFLGVLMLAFAGVLSWSHEVLAGVLSVLGWSLVALCVGTALLGWWFSVAAGAGVSLLCGAFLRDFNRHP